MSNERKLGRYHILEPLGRGSFATVHRARNVRLGNEVALKIMEPALTEDETFVRRFQQEARQTVKLDHPNIVRIMDLDNVDGRLFIAMEYVPGRNLRQLLVEEKPLPLDQVVAIVRQVGAALDYAHGRNLVHRDVKPSNILVRDDGVIKLTDFGIVKAAEGARLTVTGSVMGTPAYMSPEQTRGVDVDGRADLYALGVIAYEMVTGRVPFEGDTPFSVTYKHVQEAPPLPSSISPRAKGPLEPVLLKALAKEPADRYQTGAALTNALEAATAELQNQTLEAAYNKAARLLRHRQYTQALDELEELQAMQPGYRDVATLIERAKTGTQLAELYEQAAEHLATARRLAAQIVAVDPNFPDTKGVLQVAGRPSTISKTEVLPVTAVRRNRPLVWLQIVGLALVIASYSGFGSWKSGSYYAWGLNVLNAAGLPDSVGLPLATVGLVILLSAIQRFVPKAPAWLKNIRSFVLIAGSFLFWTTIGEFDMDASAGVWLVVAGLTLASLAEIVQLIKSYLSRRK